MLISTMFEQIAPGENNCQISKTQPVLSYDSQLSKLKDYFRQPHACCSNMAALPLFCGGIGANKCGVIGQLVKKKLQIQIASTSPYESVKSLCINGKSINMRLCCGGKDERRTRKAEKYYESNIGASTTSAENVN